MFNRALLICDLERDEDIRLVPYDDKTGKTFEKGDTLQGNLTNGIGWNMQGRPLSAEQALIICGWHVDDVQAELYKAHPWLANMTEVRQRAVMNMAFNMGVEDLLKFDTFLKFLSQGLYASAALDLMGTAWYRETGERAKRIVDMIKIGAP